MQGFEQGAWVALLAPSGVDRAIVARLNEAVQKVLNASEFRDRLVAQGVDVFGSTPEELEKLMRSDKEKWGQLIRKVGIATK